MAKKPKRKAASTAATTATSERATTKTPLARAIRLGGLLAKQYSALKRNVFGWQSEPKPTGEQRLSITKITGEIKKLEVSVDAITSNLTFLEQSKYAPKIASTRGRGVQVGALVSIKDHRYDKIVHGPVNAFTVVGESEKFLLIRAEAKGSPSIGVLRAWLARREPPKGRTAPAPAPASRQAPEPEPDTDDVDEDPGLSPEP